MFATHLSSIFKSNENVVNECDIDAILNQDLEMCLPIEPTTPKEIAKKIRMLNPRKAPGCDLNTPGMPTSLKLFQIISLVFRYLILVWNRFTKFIKQVDRLLNSKSIAQRYFLMYNKLLIVSGIKDYWLK